MKASDLDSEAQASDISGPGARSVKWLLPIGVLLTLTLLPLSDPVNAQADRRVVSLTLWPDYANQQVEAYGTVSPGSLPLELAALSDWGLGDQLQVWQSHVGGEGQPWNLVGTLDSGRILPLLLNSLESCRGA